MVWLSSLLLLTLGITRCSSAILESTTDLDQLNLEFDFIIVGGMDFYSDHLIQILISTFVKAGQRGTWWQIAFPKILTTRFWCWKQGARKISVLIMWILLYFLNIEMPMFWIS